MRLALSVLAVSPMGEKASSTRSVPASRVVPRRQDDGSTLMVQRYCSTARVQLAPDGRGQIGGVAGDGLSGSRHPGRAADFGQCEPNHRKRSLT